MIRTFVVATLTLAIGWARGAHAQEKCTKVTGLQAIVACALAASPEVREARAHLAAVAGRRATAAVVLPTNPTLSGTASKRRRPPPEAAHVFNWGLTLSQELEVAGQRSARLEVADAEAGAAARRVGVAEQEVAAAALAAYVEAMAAEENLAFATELGETARALTTFSSARAAEALLSGVEADVARAEAARLTLARVEATRRLAERRAALAVLLDVEPARLTFSEGEGTRAQGLGRATSDLGRRLDAGAERSFEATALALRGELGAAEMERKVLERRLALVRRERIPNVTLSAFAERGEINDRILGVGLSVPIPLPSPVGRTRAGEIVETLAQIDAAESSEELVRRRVRSEVARAETSLAARDEAVKLFPEDLLERTRADLRALRDAFLARQLNLRDGLPWQRSLIELQQAALETKLGRALAMIELRRVVGLPFTETSR